MSPPVLTSHDTTQTLLIQLAKVLCELKTAVSNISGGGALILFNADQGIYQSIEIKGPDGAEYIEIIDVVQP